LISCHLHIWKKTKVKIHNVININLSNIVGKLINEVGPDERLVIPDNNAIVLYSRCDGEMHIARYKLQDVMGRCI
jgi:hypothetical protein